MGVPGSFGWDVSPSVIPASMVPSYTGTSTYLLAQKYNNYARRRHRRSALNQLAVLDPGASQADAIVPTVQVMREVLTILGPTLDAGSTTARREWCINTMAADPARKSILANNEDGILYRWDLTTNTLSQSVRLNAGLGQAYTPTLVGADGGVYAISNATLYAIRAELTPERIAEARIGGEHRVVQRLQEGDQRRAVGRAQVRGAAARSPGAGADRAPGRRARRTRRNRPPPRGSRSGRRACTARSGRRCAATAP